MSPLVGTSYRLPDHARQFLGSARTGDMWGGVPWNRSERESHNLAGIATGGLQSFSDGPGLPVKALFWESDCDIDYDGPSPILTNAELLKHDKYWLPATTLQWAKPWKAANGQMVCHCDSRTFRGVVMPPQWKMFGLRMGDFCLVCYGGHIEAGQLYDIGPRAKGGEVSHAMAGAIGVGNNPRTGNSVTDLCTLAFPGSGRNYAVPPADQWEAVINLMGRLTGRIV